METTRNRKEKINDKKKRKMPLTWEKQSIQFNTFNRGHIVKPKFVAKAISNTDIMKWVKYLGVPHFKGVSSRNTLHGIPKKGDSLVINLNSSNGAAHIGSLVTFQQKSNILIVLD